MEQRTAKPRRGSGAATLDPQPGATIGGRYTIVRLIARGGVGLVYLARQAVTNNAVVVKVLAANLVGDSETNARFDREAQRLRGIQHPNIVAMVDYGHAAGNAFLVMEYLQGELLSAYASRRGPLPLADFTPIAAQILKAVGYAHRQGLMHRDLKPSNIMLVNRKGRANFVKILDFGMAKLIEGEREITSDQILGTANYLSPEQIRGEALDARVDVYAIGVMFYTLLAGHLPFIADNNAALLYKHVHEDPPPLSLELAFGHDIPPGVVALIHRCLAKAPADRPTDATAVAETLAACIPEELFHLPVAEGGAASASSSYDVLPTGVAAGPEDFSDRLTRPVQALGVAPSSRIAGKSRQRTTGPRPAVEGKAARTAIRGGSRQRPLRRESTGDGQATTGPIAGGTGRAGSVGRTGPVGRAATGRTGSITGPTGPLLAHQVTSTTSEGARAWLVIAGVVLLGLLGLGGYLLTTAGQKTDDPKASAPVDEQRMAARLDQVEADLQAGEYGRARGDLDEIEPALTDLPKLQMRVDGLRRKLRVATSFVQAQRLDQDGATAAALSAYRDILTLDPNHVGAREAINRLNLTPPPAPAVEVPASAPTPTPRPRGEKPAVAATATAPTPATTTPAPATEPRNVDRLAEGPDEVLAPEAPAEPPPAEAKSNSEPPLLDGKAKSGEPIFLPVDK